MAKNSSNSSNGSRRYVGITNVLINIPVTGSRWCFSDIKTYYNARKSLGSGRNLQELTFPELETLVQVLYSKILVYNVDRVEVSSPKWFS